jgi:membrane fusion protein (multidrug efflux system)
MKQTRIILIAVIALVIVGMALYPSWSKRRANEPAGKPQTEVTPSGSRQRPLNVGIQVVQAERLMDIAKRTATLIPDEEVDLSFEASGKITGIYFKEGTHVQKGDLLAKVNDKPLQAELKKLEAQVPLAEDRVFRQKALLEKDAVSKEAYEQVTTALETLRADIDLAKARIAQTELRAPFDGIIGLRQVSEGTYVSPTTVVASLRKIIPLKIEFSVTERDVSHLKPGAPITFTIPPDLKTYSATVYAVESYLDLNTRSLKARARFDNPGGRLIPGRTASMELVLNDIPNALTLPNEAVIKELGRDIAYLYENGKAKRIEIIAGLRTESKLQALRGLQAGDSLIVTGVMQLRDGLPVNIEHSQL